MTKHSLALLWALFTVFLLSACGANTPAAESAPLPPRTEERTFPEDAYTFTYLSLDTLTGEGERYAILDARDRFLLIGLSRSLDMENSPFLVHDQSLAEYTTALVLYDVSEQAVVQTYPLAQYVYCPDAVLTDAGFDYLSVALTDYAGPGYPYAVHRFDGESEISHSLGLCSVLEGMPHIVSVDGQTSAFCYLDAETRAYGVTLFAPDNTLQPILSRTDDDAHMLVEWGLASESQNLLYYAGTNESKTFFWYDGTETRQFSLAADDLLYDFALTEGRIVLSLRFAEGDAGPYFAVVTRDLEGNDLASVRISQPLYQLTPDGYGNLAAINSDRRIVYLQAGEDTPQTVNALRYHERVYLYTLGEGNYVSGSTLGGKPLVHHLQILTP